MFGLNQLFSSKRAGVEVLSPEEYAQAINQKKVHLIDVRTPQEYKSGHLKGALNINVFDADFNQKINRLSKDKPVFIYCQSGMRSRQAVAIIHKAGFEKIYDLRGGYSCWKH